MQGKMSCSVIAAPIKPKFQLARHVTSRHAFRHREKSWRDAGSTAQHARRDKRDTQQKRKCGSLISSKQPRKCFVI